jgi:hypothetical protein
MGMVEMSNKEQDRVWEHSRQRGVGLIVMLAIANRADGNGICWPGLDDLATRARASEKSVRRLIDAAVKAGELAIKKRPGKSHIYAILVGLSRDEKYGRLALMHAMGESRQGGNSDLYPGQNDHTTPDNLTILPRTECPPTPDNLTRSGRQTPAQMGTPVGTVCAQTGRRTIIEPSVEQTTSGWVHRLYLTTFGETVISKEQDLLTDMTSVYSERDIIDAMGITKKESAKKRIIGKCAYMQGILQRWAKYGRDPEPDDNDDDDVAPHIGFGRTLIDLRPERLRSDA